MRTAPSRYRISYTVPAFEERTTTFRVNPSVSAGFKSYFNDRQQ